MAIPKAPSTSDFLIAPCGLNCRLCRAYQRRRNPCPGCRADDAIKPKTRVICRVKICEKRMAKGIEFCSQCGEFPCAHVMHLDKRYRTKYATSVVENLTAIRDRGIAAFVENENRKWTCSGCGGTLCMHDPRCPVCGLEWRS